MVAQKPPAPPQLGIKIAGEQLLSDVGERVLRFNIGQSEFGETQRLITGTESERVTQF